MHTRTPARAGAALMVALAVTDFFQTRHALLAFPEGTFEEANPAAAWLLDLLPASAGVYLMVAVGFVVSCLFALGLLVRPSTFRRRWVQLLGFGIVGASVLTVCVKACVVVSNFHQSGVL